MNTFINKNTFKYITSTGIIGKGPGEVTRQGGVKVDSKNKILWLSDHGEMVLREFRLDRILNNEVYQPSEYIELSNSLFINRFGFFMG